MFFIKRQNKDINFSDDIVKSSLYGFIVGDALGVPVEFLSRDLLKANPIKDMEAYGTHNQPKGTWSDDTSMVLATIDGLVNSNSVNINYKRIMFNFLNWKQKREFTPFNCVFDIGNSTSYALSIYQQRIDSNNSNDVMCGTGNINSNGNGSLMRILPISLYLYHLGIDYSDYKFFEIIKTISGMTHSHIYSVLGCYIYTIYVIELLKFRDKYIAYKNMQGILQGICKANVELMDIKNIYGRIVYDDISKIKVKHIKSSGYVVDSLEASIWCLLTSNSFEETVLKAVNLGEDTDTIGALAGGLAGIVYGYEAIPKKWINDLQRKDYLDDVINSFIVYLDKIKLNNNKIDIRVNDNFRSESEKSTDNHLIELKILQNTIEDLKNNPNACTIYHGDGEFLGYDSLPSEKLNEFIKYFYDNDLIDKNYLENKKKIDNKDIGEMTYDEVITLLSWIIRGERFCSGLIYTNFKNGTILNAVERLYYLSNFDEKKDVVKKYDSYLFNYYFEEDDKYLKLIRLDDDDVKFLDKGSIDKIKAKGVLALDSFGDTDATAFGAYMSMNLTFHNVIENGKNKTFCFVSEDTANAVYFQYISEKLKNKINNDINNFYSNKELQLKWNFTILHPICLEVDDNLDIIYRPLSLINDDLNNLLKNLESEFLDLNNFFEERKILKKYIDIQNENYEAALLEIKNGKKFGHWMWYIFPQIIGLGHSEISKYYSLKSLEEAKLYLENNLLKNRLIHILDELLNLNTSDAVKIFGKTDALKLCSSMTLFYLVDPTIMQFELVIKKFFDGNFDGKTVDIINAMKTS